MIYRSTGVLNFATGQFLLLGAYIFYWLQETLGLPFLVALLGGLVLAGLAGAVTHLVLLRPLAGEAIFTPVIVSMGLAIVMTSVISIVWGVEGRLLTRPVEPVSYELPGRIFITGIDIATVTIAIATFGALFLFLAFSRAGIRMRAAAERPLLASQRGMAIDWLFGLAWAIAIAAAAIAGIAFAYKNILAPGAVELGIRGIAPALIGGLDSIRGVLLGALIVAMTEGFAVYLLGGESESAAAFTALLVVLMIRPHGLFGTPEVRRV